AIGRRKMVAAAFLFAALSVGSGFVSTTIQARRAESQSRRASQVTDFLTTMLSSADPASLGRDVTVREVLDSAAVRAANLRRTPALEAEIRTVIGRTYLALGDFEAGEAQFRQSLAAHRRRAPDGDRTTAVALTDQSHALEFLGDYGGADSVIRLAAQLLDRYPHVDPLEHAAFSDQRARILSRLGRNAEGEPLYARSLALVEARAPGPARGSLLAYALVHLGYIKRALGRHAEADSLYEAGVAAARRAYGSEHPALAAILSPYATVLDRAGKAAQAESTYLEVIAMRRQLLGAEHPDYAWTMFHYADFLLAHRRYPEAARWSRAGQAVRGHSLPDSHLAVSTR